MIYLVLTSSQWVRLRHPLLYLCLAPLEQCWPMQGPKDVHLTGDISQWSQVSAVTPVKRSIKCNQRNLTSWFHTMQCVHHTNRSISFWTPPTHTCDLSRVCRPRIFFFPTLAVTDGLRLRPGRKRMKYYKTTETCIESILLLVRYCVLWLYYFDTAVFCVFKEEALPVRLPLYHPTLPCIPVYTVGQQKHWTSTWPRILFTSCTHSGPDCGTPLWTPCWRTPSPQKVPLEDISLQENKAQGEGQFLRNSGLEIRIIHLKMEKHLMSISNNWIAISI